MRVKGKGKGTSWKCPRDIGGDISWGGGGGGGGALRQQSETSCLVFILKYTKIRKSWKDEPKPSA